MQRRKPALLGVLLGAAVFAAPAPAHAATGAETLGGTIVVDAVDGQRHTVMSIAVAHGVFDGVGTVVEVPNEPGDAQNVLRDDVVFPQGRLHLVTTALDVTVSLIPQSCRFTAAVQQSTEIAGGTGVFADATGALAGDVTAHGTAPRATDGSCDPFAATLHEVDRLATTGTMSY